MSSRLWSRPPPPLRAAPATGLTLRPMTVALLDGVATVEQAAYAFPWSRGNFVDSLAAGYLGEVLLGDSMALPVGYYVAMPGVEELHLLNITIAPAHQRQGHGRALLERIIERGRQLHARTLWLEVRGSNEPARRLYEQRGFRAIGVRRGYYPAPLGGREDATVMSLDLGRGTGGGLPAVDEQGGT
jgi:ribosomal-protein-alanine N-acetyltransferase